MFTRAGILYRCTECDSVFNDDNDVEYGHDCEA
jgi:uncharacterized C2H2 Zn-finger protein